MGLRISEYMNGGAKRVFVCVCVNGRCASNFSQSKPSSWLPSYNITILTTVCLRSGVLTEMKMSMWVYGL